MNEAPLDHPMYDWSDPTRIGPGVWWAMMKMSARSINNVDRLHACREFRIMCEDFGCEDCRNHARSYIRKNPPESHIESAMSLFKWVATFMNAVNTRIGKPTYNKKALWKEFATPKKSVTLVEPHTTKQCTSGCKVSGTQTSVTRPQPARNPTRVTSNGRAFVMVRSNAARHKK